MLMRWHQGVIAADYLVVTVWHPVGYLIFLIFTIFTIFIITLQDKC